MRTLAFSLALLCLPVAGCATLDKVQLPAAQALLVAEAGMDGANHAASAAATSGILKGDSAAKAKVLVDSGNSAVSAAHDLYSKGDIAGAVSQLNTALADVAQLQSAAKGIAQ